MPMKNPPHPGLSVRHDCLEPLGLSVTEAARKLGVSRKQLSDIVNCRSGISPEMAIRLDKAFGGGADTWYRLPVDLGDGPGTEEGGSDQGRATLACRLSLPTAQQRISRLPQGAELRDAANGGEWACRPPPSTWSTCY